AVPPETDAIAGRHFALRLAHSHRRSRLARPVQPGAPALHHYGSILLIGFTLFVLAEARRRGIRRIYFLARDGHIPLAIARRLIARSNEPFELSYLHVSRHSIVVPACSDDPHRLIEAISASMSTQTLDAIAAALGIEPDAIPGVLERSGVRPGQRLGGNTELLRRMIAANQELIGESLGRRRDLALGYLQQAGFLAPGKRLIVDTGWRGSTQQALVRLTGLPHSDLAGAYLGLWPEALGPGFDLSNAAGYLFAFGHPKPALDMVRDGYVLLELFLSAPHAPTVHYAEQDGSVVPVYGREPEPGSTIRRRAIEALEQSCLAEFDALDAMLDGAWPDAIDPASALFDLERLLTRPTREEVAAINTVPYIHTADGSSNAVAVAPIPLLELIRAPAAAVRRIERAPWRSGTLRASLPWPVPGMSFAEFRYRFERLRRLLPGG
ncbi:MAG TPA: hypothetical protein VFW75_07455, partial [Acetobacteraceae bacterium]|nr:hypothetical protein [Acetobacteraceae bacterium]